MPGRRPGGRKRRHRQPLQRMNIQTLTPCGVGVCCVVGQAAADAPGCEREPPPGAAQATEVGEASSRKAAELRRIVSPPAAPAADRLRGSPEQRNSPPVTASGSTDAPSHREEMRERSGSHGRRRYALRQGQKRRPAGLADFRGGRSPLPSPRRLPSLRLRATR